MDLISTQYLATFPDPNTDQRLLPACLRYGENAGELMRYRVALRMALEHALTDRQRQVLHMRFHLDMSMAEIGQELGVSRSTAAKRVSAALNSLRRQVLFCVQVINAIRRLDD